jgi:hypothetical protein
MTLGERIRNMHPLQRQAFADEVASLKAENKKLVYENFYLSGRNTALSNGWHKMKAENETLQKVALEAYRIHNEAHLQADHYAYDLMRTVLRPLADESGMTYPMLDALLKERE